jgi:hypothetical protein
MQTRTLMLTERQFYAGATALLIAGILAMNGVPRTAGAAAAFDAASTYSVQATVHDGVDWSRVAVTPVDTGATVGAYDR